MCEQQKTWHILGAGAIGRLWAVRLQQAGVPVRLILSPRRKSQHPDPTLTIRLRKNLGSANESLELIDTEISQSKERIQRLLVATKANDVLSALHSHAQQLEENAAIVILSNGMGYHESIASRFPRSPVLAMTSTEGAYIDANNCLVHAGIGQSKIAQVQTPGSHSNKLTEYLADQLSTPSHRLQTRKNCQRMLLDKLLINACINGLTAIYSCKNGDLLNKPQVRKRLEDLLAECQSIALANKQTALAKALQKKVHQVIRATADNYSSTYTDIANQRESEITFMNGYLIELAKQLKIAAPLNTAIVRDVTHLAL